MRSGFRSPASRTVPDGRAVERELERPGDLLDRDAVQGRLLLVGVEDERRGGGLDRVVDLDHAGLLAQPVGDRAGRGDQVGVGLVGPAVDLGHQRGEHGRAGRQLDDLDPRLVLLGDLRSSGSWSRSARAWLWASRCFLPTRLIRISAWWGICRR